MRILLLPSRTRYRTRLGHRFLEGNDRSIKRKTLRFLSHGQNLSRGVCQRDFYRLHRFISARDFSLAFCVKQRLKARPPTARAEAVSRA